MVVSRRRALALIGGGGVSSTGFPTMQVAAMAAQTRFVVANIANDGAYAVAMFDDDGARQTEYALPHRAHGMAFDPNRRRLAVVARRPGTRCDVFDLDRSGRQWRLDTPPGHHFYGHAVFSSDGAWLYTTENEYGSGAGVIGVWKATSGFRRFGQFSSGGIGPHEIALLPDGETLAVANGGIRTHPGSGREKLNLATMSPVLAYIDSRTGNKMAELEFDRERLRKLSIRHIAVGDDGTVCIALQDQGGTGEVTPLVVCHRLGRPGFRPLVAPRWVTRRMRGYTGSVAFDTTCEIAAVSAPRGNLVTFWNIKTASFLNHYAITDGCGVAATGRPGTFLLTSGVGGAVRYDARRGTATALGNSFVAHRSWDNHLLALPNA